MRLRACQTHCSNELRVPRRSPAIGFGRTHRASKPQRVLLARANEEPESGNLQTLPIFPLGMVALPTADVPLQIFEARYRVLFHTLLSGGDGIEPELVQNDSPFKGTKKFGMCYVHKQGLAAYGTVLEIKQYQVLQDGRLLVLTKGLEKFKVKKIEQEKPVLLCEVEMVADEAEDESLKEAAGKAKEMFRNVLELNAKYKKLDVKDEHLNPPELDQWPASKLSYWIASMFANSPELQQKVLETESAKDRLNVITSTLEETLKHTTAALAIENVFASPSAEDSSENPDGEATSQKEGSGGEQGNDPGKQQKGPK